MSQYALTGGFPGPPELNQYRSLGASPSEDSLISRQDKAGSNGDEPRKAVKMFTNGSVVHFVVHQSADKTLNRET